MDAAPRAFDLLPRDPELGTPVPFACGTAEYGAPPGGPPPSVRDLDHRRVTQCALSRVCGVCGAGLGRPLGFLGTRAEADRNAFIFPACHVYCARALMAAVRDADGPLLGHAEADPQWVLRAAAAFEFVRPGREERERRPTFQPHSPLSETEYFLPGQSGESPATSAGLGPL